MCGAASQVVVKPVLDPTAHDPVDTSVVPDRHREVIAVRDQTCVFPWCTRPARCCDADHTIPSSRGGPTCPCNEASLCRRHHRVKTFAGWTYTTLDAGTYLWSSPHGYRYLRDQTGTQDDHPTLTTTPRTPPHPAGPPACPAPEPADRDPHRGRVKRGVAPQPPQPQPTPSATRRASGHGAGHGSRPSPSRASTSSADVDHRPASTGFRGLNKTYAGDRHPNRRTGTRTGAA